MALSVKPGIPLTNAAQGLHEAVVAARNPLPMGFGPSMNHYGSWISHQADVVLRNYFDDPALWDRLRGDAYWHIQRMTEANPRWHEIIHTEMKRQADDLEVLEREIRQLQARLDARAGLFAVLDTHVLLHFQPPAGVPWEKVVGSAEVRLVLPIRVVEELDEKKYTGRPDVADRARRLLSQLRPHLTKTAGLPVPLRDNVTIEVPVEVGPRHRSLDADYEVLQSCLELKALGRRVLLVTGDTGLAIRATREGVEAIDMPEEYLRNRPVDAT